MLCLSGFELYSRWVPLFVLLCVSSTNSELTTDLDDATKDEGKARVYLQGGHL